MVADYPQSHREDRIHFYLPGMLRDNQRPTPIVWDFNGGCEQHYLGLLRFYQNSFPMIRDFYDLIGHIYRSSGIITSHMDRYNNTLN